MWLWLIILGVLTISLQIPIVKGFIGELFVQMWLGGLDKDEYIIINDVMILTSAGSTQIDHIVVSEYGIFVIETKNYKGWIFGSEHGKYWTQVIYRNKNKFYNPVLQNKGHVKALENLLSDKPKLKYISIVTFGNKANFKKLDVLSHVVHNSQLVHTIRLYTERNVDSAEMENVVEIIKQANNKDRIARKEHIRHVKDKSHNKLKQTEEYCPLCGKILITKKGRYGSFKGCSNYPDCTYSQKLNI